MSEFKLPHGVQTDDRWNVRVRGRPTRRERVVTDHSTGGTKVVSEPVADPVRAAVTAALSHAVLTGRTVAPPEDFDADQRARFWALISERRERVRRG